jgi:hypothetical protein
LEVLLVLVFNSNILLAGFGAPIWRRTLLCVAGGIAFYELMGAPNDNQGWLPSLGRIAPSKDWTDIAARRAVEAASLGEQTQFFKTATRPPIYRSRAPESVSLVFVLL